MGDLEDRGHNDPRDPGAYCRAIEAHLCRRNAGHLVRIVGPSFDLVSGWAERGVPLRVACHGIDRYVDRQAAKGTPGRRPIRIEFCEADVLDVFDEWRRAVGAPPRDGEAEGVKPARRAAPLRAHLDRVVARLTALQARADIDSALLAVATSIVHELEQSDCEVQGLRGPARDGFLARLSLLDAGLLAAARDATPPGEMTRLTQQADQELQSFRDRMTPEAHAAAVTALVDRLVRERYQLPFVAVE
jgi:hypothetical protein